MKILVFNWKDIKHPYAGGAEVNIHEQAKRWVKSGHKVVQFSPKFRGAKPFEVIDGVEIFRGGGRFSVYIIAFFYYLFCLRKQCDVIIDIENGIPFFTPLFSRKPKVCIMHHVHQDVFFRELPFCIAWVPLLLERYGLRIFYRNTKFIAVSETTRGNMVRMLGINLANIDVVYNGLNHKDFITNVAKTKNPSIIYFGRLMKYKRIDLLVDIFAAVLKQVPDARLYIAGTGIVEDDLKLKVKNMNLDAKVYFYGYVDDAKKRDILKSSWLFVNPSSMEGWGVTVIEANAVGVPALAFNVPGLSEAIKNNETGFVVENEAQMVDQIVRVLRDNKLRNRLGNNALAWSKKFSWDEAANRTLKILEGLR